MSRNTRLALPILLAGAVSAVSPAAAEINPNRPAPPPALQAFANRTFIVVFRDSFRGDARAKALEIAGRNNTPLRQIYDTAIRGFAADMSDLVANLILRNTEIAFIERDAVVTTQQTRPISTASAAPGWGVARVGGSAPASAAAKAWIIDTGVEAANPYLNIDRANAYTAVGATWNDEHGHGTHVAGTVAANTNFSVPGVAPGASVVPVRVLDANGYGTISGVIAGVNWVANRKKNCAALGLPCAAPEAWVANMSLGGGSSRALDNAVTAAANAGVRFAIAAGNNARPARNYSPAGVNNANVFTVSALCSSSNGAGYCPNGKDSIATFSNYGNPPVEYAAPGDAITSLNLAKYGGGATVMSGTSMAAPHVAGLLLRAPGLTSASTSIASWRCGQLTVDRDANRDPIAFVAAPSSAACSAALSAP